MHTTHREKPEAEAGGQPAPEGNHAAAALYDFMVVSNRLPVDRCAPEDSGCEDGWRRSPGGLVTALAPMMTKTDGAWVGWHGAPDETITPFSHGGMDLVPVQLSNDDVELYYEGFSNATLWPLYHDVIAPPEFHRTWWDSYRKVNRRFADAVVQHADHGATVWVQDYQLQLVPKMLREARPDLKIGFFNHIPFPPPEIFAQLPWRRAIIDGLLGADLVGFQRSSDAGNFMRSARRFLGASVKQQQVHVKGANGETTHIARAQAFPISIDVKQISELARKPEIIERAQQIRRDLGNPKTILLGRRPPGLHQGHPAPAQGLRGAACRRQSHGGGRSPDPGGEPQPRARGTVPPAARGGRGHRGPYQRHLRHHAEHRRPLPAPQLPRRGDGGAVPGRRRHAGHRAARRHEPGGQGVRDCPDQQRRRPGAQRIRRRSGPAQAGTR